MKLIKKVLIILIIIFLILSISVALKQDNPIVATYIVIGAILIGPIWYVLFKLVEIILMTHDNLIKKKDSGNGSGISKDKDNPTEKMKALTDLEERG